MSSPSAFRTFTALYENMITILGITLTHDGTLTIVRDGVHVYSLPEERINRVKCFIGFPFAALRYLVQKKIIDPSEISAVAVASGVFKKEWARSFALELVEDKKYYDFQNDKPPKDFYINDKEWRSVSSDDECKQYVEKKIRAQLEAVGITAPILFYDHHLCHAVAAYVTGGRNEALAITLDGEGDLKSGTVNICRSGAIETIASIPDKHSIGWLYSEVTRHCGFKTSRHEGKITGLAAYGNPKAGWDIIKKDVSIKNGLLFFRYSTKLQNILMRIRAKLGLEQYAANHWRRIIFKLAHLSREDMAAAVQYALEERVAEFVSYWVEKTGIRHVVTAGGVFANVKLNQRIAELSSVDSFFVFPNMGDGGNAYGAAMLAHQELTKAPLTPARINNVYLGPEYSNEEIETVLKKHVGLAYRKSNDVAKEAARLVADKKIVGWFQGRMEYGPRALGNRSVVVHPTDASINAWLNKRMKRTEFMPFAPSCLYEAAEELFEIKKETMKFPAEFMTITFKMKEGWVKKAPAVAHVDGTARPQLVKREVNPRYYALIEEYKRITGLPLLINTSFNVHEEPIVMSPDDAIASLTRGMLDVLVMNDYIVTRS